MKNFVTIFDRAKNFHLVKDVGQVPYHMHKEFGYNSTLITCKNDLEYKYLDDEVKGLKINFIPKIKLFKINLGVVLYLINNAKKIDVLQQFHIRNYTLFYAFIYKIFNKKGINYIKADANEKYLLDRGFIVKKKHLNKIRKFVDILSFETSNAVRLFREQNPDLQSIVLKLSNGIDEKYIFDKLSISKIDCSEKINSIIYVARIGTYQKNTELFLNAVEKIDLNNWHIHMIGEIEEGFKKFIDLYFEKNVHLMKKITFHGNISSRKEIYELYSKSKIFCMSSRFEGFPLVYPEVLFFGNYILTTDVSGCEDITSKEKYGTIVKDFSVESYAKSLEELINSENINNKLCSEIKDYASKKYTWQKIVYNLDKCIKDKTL